MRTDGGALRRDDEDLRWERAVLLARRLADMADAQHADTRAQATATNIAGQLEEFAATAEELAHELGALLDQPQALELLIELLALLSDVTVRFHAGMLSELGDRTALAEERRPADEPSTRGPLAVEIAAAARRLRALEMPDADAQPRG